MQKNSDATRTRDWPGAEKKEGLGRNLIVVKCIRTSPDSEWRAARAQLVAHGHTHICERQESLD